MGGRRRRRGFSGPSGRLRDRPCRHSPPSSGSSNACLSAPRHASSGRVCNPIQLQRRIERAMEGERLTTSDRTLVPEPLRRPPPSGRPGRVRRHDRDARVRARRRRAGVRPGAPLHGRRPAAGRPRRRSGDRADRHPRRRTVRRGRSGRTRRIGPGGGRTRWRRPGGRFADATDTRVFAIPEPDDPAGRPARDRSGRADATGRHRGGQPDDRARDRQRPRRAATPRVSRHHGRIAGRRGTLVYADLGSTNGSRVNGVPVTEVVLGVGDRLEVGDTALVVEVAGAPD